MSKTIPIQRRTFLKNLASMSALGLIPYSSLANLSKSTGMKMGLVTYLWGKDWDVPTLIKN
jgi:hypothetical protein